MCIPAQILLEQPGLPTIGGEGGLMTTFSIRNLRLPISSLPSSSGVGLWAVWSVLMTVTLVGCGPLEPIVEQEVSDLQLTVDTLRTSLRDSQRTIAELRSELESRRQELADSQIARAQMEGRIREAERRLTESRHVIELQREELVASRAERQRASQTGASLQSQLRQLQKQLSKMGKQFERSGENGTAPANLSSANTRPSAVHPVIMGSGSQGAAVPRGVPIPTEAMRSEEATGGEDPAHGSLSSSLSVRPGDTLWSIAQRFHVTVQDLMRANALPNQQILVGQAIRIPSRIESSTPLREKSE